jgi:hypothetical protein
MRRTKTITIQDREIPNPQEGAPPLVQPAGRDAGKVFIITEMPATLADEWVTQYGYLLAKALQEFPTFEEGSAGAQLIQVRVLKDPSLRAWRDCVKYQPADPRQPAQVIHWESTACQIEEIGTVNFLLREVFDLHTGFFSDENPSTTGSPSATSATGVSSTMQTSRRPLAPSSLPGVQR